MPFRIDPDDNKCIQKQDENGDWQQENCHDNPIAATAQLRALNASEDGDDEKSISTLSAKFDALFDYVKSLNPLKQDDGESSFKVVGNHWIARYSNAFKDRDDEYFPGRAIDNYIWRTEIGIVPMPELWVYHIPRAIGKTKLLARIGNFAIAAGSFVDDEFGIKARDYLKANKAKNSHGFSFFPEALKDRAYWDFNTFEITVLPFGRRVEANAYTNIEVKTMSEITDEKRQFLKDMFGEDAAERFIEDTAKASKALEDIGVEFKDFTKPEDVEDDDNGQKDKSNDDSEHIVLSDMMKDMATLAENQLRLAQTVKTLAETAATQDKQIKVIKLDLAGTPRRASDDKSTIIDLEKSDEFITKLAEEIRKKEQEYQDTPEAKEREMWAGMVEEEGS